jgi:hypothetical protein
MSDDVVKVLTKARALIVGGWTRGTYARDSRRRRVPAKDPSAAAFCCVGACRRASYDIDGVYDTDAVWALGLHTEGQAVPMFNDNAKSKAVVLRAFDRAIAAEEQKAEKGRRS